MTIDAWLSAAIADAERRGLPELKPILEALARATAALRAADFNDHANGESPRPSGSRSGLGAGGSGLGAKGWGLGARGW